MPRTKKVDANAPTTTETKSTKSTTKSTNSTKKTTTKSTNSSTTTKKQPTANEMREWYEENKSKLNFDKANEALKLSPPDNVLTGRVLHV